MPYNSFNNEANSNFSGGAEGQSFEAYSSQKLDRAHRGPVLPASGTAAADGWPGSAPQSTSRSTGSRCAPGDLAS
jgi:hypothetical protein